MHDAADEIEDDIEDGIEDGIEDESMRVLDDEARSRGGATGHWLTPTPV